MAQTLPSGVVVPNADGQEPISETGIQEMRTLGASVDTALATLDAEKADSSYVDAETSRVDWFKGPLPPGSLNNARTPGLWMLSPGNTYTDAPPGHTDGIAAWLTVDTYRGVGWGGQSYRQFGAAQYIADRQSQTSTLWGGWRDDSAATRDAQMRHQLRVDEFKRRRGGVIGTNGVGVVGFRFDHYYKDWKDKILPLMRQHQIVGTMAMHGTGATGIGGTGYDWADLQASHLNDGLEIMAHSYDHNSKSSPADLETEIAWSRDIWLKGRLPQVLIEGWMMPGAEYGAMGQLIDSMEKLWGTLAGRMLMANYAVVSGHRDGYYRQLTGDVDAGLAHITIETDTTAAAVKTIIDKAAATRTGVVFMMHPSLIGTTGYMPTAVLGEIFAYVAQLRDAGKLANLTVGGMSLADAWTDRREDLAVNGSFTDGLAGWTGAGWAASNGRATSPADVTELTQSEFISRRSVITGSPRELVITARSTGTSSTVRLAAMDSTGSTGLNASKDFTLGAAFTTHRMFFTIPHDGTSFPQINLRWAISRQAGSAIEVESVQVRPV